MSPDSTAEASINNRVGPFSILFRILQTLLSTKMIRILYGSQTGTAKSEATLLALQLNERGAKTEVESLDEFDVVKLPETELCVFMVSTTGITKVI